MLAAHGGKLKETLWSLHPAIDLKRCLKSDFLEFGALGGVFD